jgi:hypothetical protein
MATMFSSCFSLKTVPLFDTSALKTGAEMFSGCINLQSIPQFNTTGINVDASNMFTNCISLCSGRTSGIRYSVNYANCKLSISALNDIFSGLGAPAASSPTITITNNPGASGCNRAIASGKLWTVSG